MIKIIGKLNISYFLIDIFYKLRAELYENHTEIDKKNYNNILANRSYRKDYNLSNQNHQDFIKILKVFKSEVEKNKAKFIILLYPDPNLINFYKKEIIKHNIDIEYFILDKNLMTDPNLRFKNDGHWNEYGNVLFAENLLNIFDDIGIKSEKIDYDIINKDIDLFYNEYNG